MRRPDWIRTRVPSGSTFVRVNDQLKRHGLQTVCTHARCPNLAECWNRGTATFMILGDTCTRHCRFCSVKTGRPQGVVDRAEPERVAAAAHELGLRYVVLTSVDRDDLEDLGAGAFAKTVRALKRTAAPSDRGAQIDASPADSLRVEVLTPDFDARRELIQHLAESRPDVFGHNVETVERLSSRVRDKRASYRASLEVLRLVKEMAPDMPTKSGLMVGLGEVDAEVEQTLADLREAGCDIVTVGQYLQPGPRCLPVERYVEPARFEQWQEQAKSMGFRNASCGPLVRSSYMADRILAPRPSAIASCQNSQ